MNICIDIHSSSILGNACRNVTIVMLSDLSRQAISKKGIIISVVQFAVAKTLERNRTLIS